MTALWLRLCFYSFIRSWVITFPRCLIWAAYCVHMFGGWAHLAKCHREHVWLFTHQLLHSSAFLPKYCLSNVFFLSLSLPSCMHTRFLSFSLFTANSLCGGRVAGVFASHMAMPGASGADVLSTGALLHHAHTHMRSQRHNTKEVIDWQQHYATVKVLPWTSE